MALNQILTIAVSVSSLAKGKGFRTAESGVESDRETTGVLIEGG